MNRQEIEKIVREAKLPFLSKKRSIDISYEVTARLIAWLQSKTQEVGGMNDIAVNEFINNLIKELED